MYKDVIGIIGGMGSFATCDFFCRLVEAFPAQKEWDRPRILIDNKCTMPSRVRAIIYKEERAKLVYQLTEALIGLKDGGATKIVIACNTSHIFLDEITDLYESIKGNRQTDIINIVELTARKLKEKGIKRVSLMATEGTIDSGIYDSYLQEQGIELIRPSKDMYKEFRFLIERVKQNQIDEEAIGRFTKQAKNLGSRDVLLACTEFPIYFRHTDKVEGINFYDPLEFAIGYLKEELK